MAAESGHDKFKFTALPTDALGNLKNKSKDSVELFQKWWVGFQQDCNSEGYRISAGTIIYFFAHYLSFAHRGLEGRMKCATFTYNAHFQTYQKDTFALVCTPFCAIASSTPPWRKFARTTCKLFRSYSKDHQNKQTNKKKKLQKKKKQQKKKTKKKHTTERTQP